METKEFGFYAQLENNEKENYVRPELMVMELDCEGIICSSTNGTVGDPRRGEEGYWPGFMDDGEF